MRLTPAARHHRTACHRGPTGPPGPGKAPSAVRATALLQPAVDAAHGVRHSLRHAVCAVLPPAAWFHWQPDGL